MVVQPLPASPFKVTQPDLLFEFPVAQLAGPALLGHSNQVIKRCLWRQITEVILPFPAGTLLPYHPGTFSWKVLSSGVLIAIRETDIFRCECSYERSLRPLAS